MKRTRVRRADADAQRPEHPTRTALIETARRLLSTHALLNVTADMVLELSGISKGSLYHHFEDFEDLIGTAMVREFSDTVQRNIELSRDGLARCDSAESIQTLIRAIMRELRTPAMKRHRHDRVSLIAFCHGNPKLQQMLAAEQARLTGALTDLFAEAQDRGWISREFQPNAAAVLIQACGIGQIVDDITPEPLDDEAWFRILDALTARVLAQHP